MRAPSIKTPPPGPRARAVVERDHRVISPSYPRSAPLVIARAEGATVEDVDGNVFLDCCAGIAVASTGHAHPEVVRAIQEQAAKFIHISTDYYHEPMVALAEAVAALAPVNADGGIRVFMSNSGAEAIEAAIKLARYRTRRPNIIAFLGSFHGRTLGALSLTASRSVQRRGFGPMAPGVFHAPYADPYRGGGSAEDCAAAALDYIEREILVHLVSPDEVAAIVVEPIQGEGGYVVPPAPFIQGLARIASRHGMLLVADEVQSGMGRTGRMFAMEHFGVKPDITVIAKAIASGLPMGLTVAGARVMDWPAGAHSNTFGGNPIACAAALATIRLLESGLVEHAARVGDHLIGRLRDVAGRHAIVGDVRGKGLMIGLELVGDRRTKEPAIRERDALVLAAFRRGLLMLAAGPSSVPAVSSARAHTRAGRHRRGDSRRVARRSHRLSGERLAAP